jgi:hypothetical protein
MCANHLTVSSQYRPKWQLGNSVNKHALLLGPIDEAVEDEELTTDDDDGEERRLLRSDVYDRPHLTASSPSWDDPYKTTTQKTIGAAGAPHAHFCVWNGSGYADRPVGFGGIGIECRQQQQKQQ